MKITTWNVNSLRVRLPHVLNWLSSNPVDAIGLQETKLTDDKFPVDELRSAGWHAAFHGQKTYNGVALLSREPAADVVRGIPGFDDAQARVIAGTVGGTRVINVYVPNGQAVGSDKYDYKLGWLAALNGYLRDTLAQHRRVAVVGDFNIAPAPEDTHDPAVWEGKILCSDAERARFRELLEAGTHDCFRRFDHPDKTFTWWDYRQLGFQLNKGLRIDHVLASDALAADCTACSVDREPRKWEKPSDHAPVTAEFST